jgi:hypothetical protein
VPDSASVQEPESPEALPESEDAAETAATPAASTADDPDLTKIDTLVWEETRDAPAPARRVPLEREPLSVTRKFVYFLIALSPFIAFVLLLPRGGEDSPAVEEQSPSPPVSRQAVPLAFPFESPTPVTDLPSPESVVMDSSASFQCSDGVDNDRDGRRDFPADSGCSSASDNVESSDRRPAAPPPPPPPPAPAPAPAPPSPSEEPPPSPEPPPAPVFPPPAGPDCDPDDRGFPICGDADEDVIPPAPEEPPPDPEDSTD